MNDWERQICARVKLARESLGLSQSGIATSLSITRDRLAAIEGGHTPLRYQLAWHICEALGISMRWLSDEDADAGDFDLEQFPTPDKTGLRRGALLTAVVEHLENKDPGPPPDAATLAQQAELLAAAAFRQSEEESGKTDVPHRLLIEMMIVKLAQTWVARAPLGKAEALCDALLQAANKFIGPLSPEDEKAFGVRYDEMMWERAKRARADRLLSVERSQNKLLTDASTYEKLRPVKSQLKNLRAKLAPFVSQPGYKTKLAEFVGAPLASVSRWLSGSREPGGEIALRMLVWAAIIEAEQQQKRSDRASTRPEPKTQVQSSKHENQAKVRKKR